MRADGVAPGRTQLQPHRAGDHVTESGDVLEPGRQGAAALAAAGPRVSRRRWAWAALLAVWGPGIIVMLADCDAGCLITAAQSGAQWGYRLILPSLLLIPVLYVVQEMTVRLGIHTGQGHSALIRERFWPRVGSGVGRADDPLGSRHAGGGIRRRRGRG